MHREDQDQRLHPEQPEEETASAPETASGPTTEPDAAEDDELTVTARERDQFREMAQRAQADLINYRRRVDEERLNLARSAASQVLTRFLPILDDLQRAVDHLPEDSPESWSEGISMVLRKLHTLLEAEGVSPFSPEPGALFDPTEHEAVLFEPSDDYQQGAVVSTLRPGYRDANRVLRPAQVAVAQAPTEQPA